MSSNVVYDMDSCPWKATGRHCDVVKCRLMSYMDTSVCNVAYDVVRHGFMSYTTWRLSPECRIRCRIMSYAKSSSRCNSPGRAHVVPHVVPMSYQCRQMSYTTWTDTPGSPQDDFAKSANVVLCRTRHGKGGWPQASRPPFERRPEQSRS